MLLPGLDDSEAVETIMNAAHGLLLTGGGDIDPLLFNEEPQPSLTGLDSRRDAAEMEAARIALEKGMPVFGICRGIQLLNIALGGTLVQDINSSMERALEHQTRETNLFLGHSIAIEEGSLLSEILGSTETMVNSRHHQAVKIVGAGMKISARSEDGIIEGIEADNGKPILGLQCHPENSAEEHPRFQNLFNWLVTEADKFRT